jgi:hypothetical protein
MKNVKQIVKAEKLDSPANRDSDELQKLVRNPTTVGVLEYLTGLSASVIDKRSN